MFPVTASEAAFLEGGIYYKILKNNEFERLDELNNYINLTLSDVLSMQILSAQDYIDKTNHSYEGDVDLLIGAYCSGRNDGLYYCQYLRNDITQHASSAVLNYYNLYEEFN